LCPARGVEDAQNRARPRHKAKPACGRGPPRPTVVGRSQRRMATAEAARGTDRRRRGSRWTGMVLDVKRRAGPERKRGANPRFVRGARQGAYAPDGGTGLAERAEGQRGKKKTHGRRRRAVRRGDPPRRRRSGPPRGGEEAATVERRIWAGSPDRAAKRLSDLAEQGPGRAAEKAGREPPRRGGGDCRKASRGAFAKITSAGARF